MITSAFHRQVVKPFEDAQKRAAYAAADLLKEDKFRDEKGNLASFYCTGYMMTLAQGTALVSALTDDEQNRFKDLDRDVIAQQLAERIKNKDNAPNDLVAATYWNNKFMQLDARTTMSYTAGNFLDEASNIIAGKAAPAA